MSSAPLLVYMTGMLACLLGAGCRAPDPDALLRRHDLDGAATAWEQVHGERVSLDHTVADILAQRAATDPGITMPVVLDTLDAVRTLDATAHPGTEALDTGFDRLADLLGAAEILAAPPFLVVVGRSETRLDKDPYLGGALPWARGRVVGWARRDAAAFGARIDADPPLRLVTVLARDATGAVSIGLEHREGAWWTLNAADAHTAARLVAAAANLSLGADALARRYGKGLVPIPDPSDVPASPGPSSPRPPSAPPASPSPP